MTSSATPTVLTQYPLTVWAQNDPEHQGQHRGGEAAEGTTARRA